MLILRSLNVHQLIAMDTHTHTHTKDQLEPHF